MTSTTELQTEALYQEIEQLKKRHNAVILAHYYQRPEIQKAADYLGDSLGLSQQAAQTDADIIVFCGVHFMAETASIIAPQKKVLIPVANAGCTLAESVTGQDLALWKKNHPNGLVVSYVNTTAEVKAETDYCVTSANALRVVKSLPQGHPILFGPDQNLGRYISLVTGIEMDYWQGDCYVHRRITAPLVSGYLDKYPDADILIHPESVATSSPEIVQHPRCFVGSTTSIMTHPGKSDKKQFVIATEAEVLYELNRLYPDKEFIAMIPEYPCEYMKQTTLTDLRNCLKDLRYEVRVPEEVRQKAIIPIERMLSL